MTKFPGLLDFAPTAQYFVDGSTGSADVFIDPSIAAGGSPNSADRDWRTVLVGGLRQGGNTYYALDVTQPDHIDLTPGPTFGNLLDPLDNSPSCLDQTDGAQFGSSCQAGPLSGARVNRDYPTIMWEIGDEPDPVNNPGVGVDCSDGCNLTPDPAMGQTWSRPVVGRIRVFSGPVNSPTFEDRYVAIFGGGFDPSFSPGDDVAADVNGGIPVSGRAFYMVDVETGKILYKVADGINGDVSDGGNTVNFAPMPAPAAVADYDDDGYLDVAYIGDVNGKMWRIDLTPNTDPMVLRGQLQADGQVHNYQPFLLFDSCALIVAPTQCSQSIFYEPGIVYLGGSVAPPALGIAWGSGNRAELVLDNPEPTSFYYVTDVAAPSGGGFQIDNTFNKGSLLDITTGQCPTPCAATGFVLDFASPNEKATSTVFSTLGYLSVLTYTPDSANPCGNKGNSYRYRFFYLTGAPGYVGDPNMIDNGFGQALGAGVVSASQSINANGDIIDTTLYSVGNVRQDTTPGALKTIEQNWKEQQ